MPLAFILTQYLTPSYCDLVTSAPIAFLNRCLE